MDVLATMGRLPLVVLLLLLPLLLLLVACPDLSR
jgi:hypothetical protein